MPKTPASEKVTAPEAKPVEDKPIQFNEPISAADQVAVVADSPDQQLLSEAQMSALYAEANRDNTKRNFTLKVLASRAKEAAPEPAPPPLAPRMAEQTRLEIEAGRKMNEHHASLAAKRPPVTPTPQDGRSTPVFRPNDYVPDQKKGQGYTQARDL